MGIARDTTMQLLAYFFAKFATDCSQGNPRGKPPEQVEAETWSDAYRRFYDHLGGGRSEEAWLASLRKDHEYWSNRVSGRRADISDVRSTQFEEWSRRSREDVWAELQPYMS